MFIDYKDYEDFDKGTRHFKGQFVSPGTFARDCGVTRQGVHYWINNDFIDAHRYKGDEGDFIFIPLEEYGKLKARKK